MWIPYVVGWFLLVPLLSWLMDRPWTESYRASQRLRSEERERDARLWQWALARRRRRNAEAEWDQAVDELSRKGL